MDPTKAQQTQTSAGSGRPAEAGRTEPAQRAIPQPTHAPYPAQEKLTILRAYAASPASMRDFCAAHGLTTKTLCAWRKRFDEGGEAALEPRPNPRNASGWHRGHFTPEQRREAVEAFAVAHLPKDDFCRIWGLGRSTLQKWLRRYREEGPQGLETRKGRRRKPPAHATPESVKEQVRETKRREPSFGLRKIRDWLFRHGRKKVSATTVKKVLVPSPAIFLDSV